MCVLADPEWSVRSKAAEVLGYIDKEALTPHAGAIKNVLANSKFEVHHAATVLLRKLDPVTNH